ncbi:MAG: zinc ribbon domain-containing protein [Thermoguttaceae bacterium]
MSSSQLSVSNEVLRKLHRIHQQLGDLRERLRRGPQIAQAHEANVTRLEKQLEELRAKVKSTRVAADAKQLQLQSGEAAVKRRRQQLLEAKSNVEYQALKDQIAADEMANSVLADEALELLEKLDQFNAQLKAAEDALAKARHEADKSRQEYEGQTPLIQNDLKRLEAELKQTEAELPGGFLDLYRRLIRAKGGDALAPVRGEYCAGCNQHVPINMCAELMLSRPICCKSCGRLLYLPEDRSAVRQA